MIHRSSLCAPIAPALCAFALCTVPAAAQDSTPEQAEIETALAPLVTFRGETPEVRSIAQRMADLGIANASVAVVRDGKLEWARGYGEGIDADTLYQAASLSKAVAAAGIAALALDRGVSLDADISADLRGLDLAQINPDGVPITLRGLLSHTNGAAVSGFPGYAAGAEVPTTAQVIMGAAPTNTDMVVISAEGVGSYSYSGGGYTIAQYWAEQVTGEPFPAIMRRYVLDPVGMDRSLFSAERQGDLPRDNVALAYNGDGSPVEGGWHVYPEYAAASLWTTPSEYALFATALMRALAGERDAGLPGAVAREMTSTVANDYGLGIGTGEVDGAVRLNHSGSNKGYKSNFMAYPASDDLIVVMTGADNGWPLVGDIGRTTNIVYDWPRNPPLVRDRLPASKGELVALSGSYAMQGNEDLVVTLEPDGSELKVIAPSGQSWNLVRIGNATWIDPADGQELTFVADTGGGMTVSDGGPVFERR
ncbi:serine hydrolase domain-containing protein [Aurantiacibacter odishensis]|uniref:serine hydrolase domain-containing protein n=1 Tax=Aurantiacibacter odishensis TaxID=1155476 RepID=UPI000E7361CE|nr:serine hydrolase domain-containing protein [Aurantiacibacter odishensis]